MLVSVNGVTKEFPDGISLIQLLEGLSLSSRKMAIEVNKQVIRKKDWADLTVAEQDKIEIVHFVGGG